MAQNSRVLPFSQTQSFAEAMRGQATLRCGAEPFCLNGPSAAVARLWLQIQRVAPYFRTALLTGEPGTGAEFAALALHNRSPLRAKPLRVLSASTSEIYLAKSGQNRRGFDHGTVYFEELEKLSAAAQKELVSHLRSRGLRTGSVIGFVRGDLKALVSAGRFSAELAASLNGLRIALPSLRERAEDVPGLLQAIAAKLSRQMGRPEPRLGSDFLAAASAFAWPGNLDQMGEVMLWLLRERCGPGLCREEFLAACEAYESKQQTGSQPVRLVRLEAMVQEHVHAVLLACRGNKLRAAEILGISRSTLYRMLDATLLADAG